ncbi:hypothetical protein FBU30_003570 [Linnemannia zychae]|nr:hypothetical protein FBU30_003570 [Linnemannia zychae]
MIEKQNNELATAVSAHVDQAIQTQLNELSQKWTSDFEHQIKILCDSLPKIATQTQLDYKTISEFSATKVQKAIEESLRQNEVSGTHMLERVQQKMVALVEQQSHELVLAATKAIQALAIHAHSDQQQTLTALEVKLQRVIDKCLLRFEEKIEVQTTNTISHKVISTTHTEKELFTSSTSKQVAMPLLRTQHEINETLPQSTETVYNSNQSVGTFITQHPLGARSETPLCDEYSVQNISHSISGTKKRKQSVHQTLHLSESYKTPKIQLYPAVEIRSSVHQTITPRNCKRDLGDIALNTSDVNGDDDAKEIVVIKGLNFSDAETVALSSYNRKRPTEIHGDMADTVYKIEDIVELTPRLTRAGRKLNPNVTYLDLDSVSKRIRAAGITWKSRV